MNNPLLQWKQGYPSFDNTFDFSQLKVEHFLPATETSFQWALANIEKIEANPEPPTFANTIEALETAAEDFEWVTGIYFNLFSAEANEELQSLAEKISPLSAKLSSRIFLSEPLFARVKQVWEKKDQLGLDTEAQQLLKKTYRAFVREGALLPPNKKEELRELDQRLSKLSPQFSQNVLKATNEYTLEITQESDLKGLPDFAIETAREEAQKRGKKDSWIFTLQFPSYYPFMQYAENRKLRETLWRAYSGRCVSGPYSNLELIRQILSLREKRAGLLGYPNHAAYVLEERMAKDANTVMNFLGRMIDAYRPMAEKDLNELREFAKQRDGLTDFMPWDVAYYSEKLKEAKYQFNEEDLRPYFKLENVLAGVFTHAKKLYDLDFIERQDIPKYHPDVRTFEVRRGSEYIATFYADFFPRETKKSGAWMSSFREQGLWNGQVLRPHVMIVCNFTKPTAQKPSLLSFDEVSTLFHEFGHALHGMLSQCRYRSLAGTNVKWDFVELPSQIMENWIYEKESLDLFAKHYETGASIPEELVKKLKAAKNFQAGLMGLRQMNFAWLDMQWHLTPVSQIQDLLAFETQVTEKTRLFPPLAGTASSPTFSHIFAGGYSSGYYSYKWAEVLDADAFEFFKEKGLFSKEVASRFADFILSQGAKEEPEVLYEKFRGRPAQLEALLRKEGILPETATT